MKYNALLKFICCACLLTMISACSSLTQSGQKSVSSGNGTSGANKTTVASDVTTSGSGDARDEVVKAYQALLDRPFYRVHTVGFLTDGSEKDGTNTAFTMDYVAPDRYEIKRETEPQDDVIGIGKDSWFKKGDQPWKKSPVNIGAMKDMQKSWLNKINNKNAEIKLVGTDSLDGAPMNIYQIAYNVKDEDLEMTVKGAGKVWIGATDHLPHKAEIETQTEENDHSKMTVTYDYTTNAKIEPPM